MKFWSLLGLILLSSAIFTLSSCNEDNIDPCGTAPTVKVVRVVNYVQDLRTGSLVVSGTGNEPLSYSIDGVTFQTATLFSDLAAGTYTLMVRDANNCENTTTAQVGADPLVSFLRDVRPVLTDNCQISGCHCDGNSLCFATYEVVKEYSQGIKERTAGRAMPPATSGRVLTDQQIRTIGDWVDQGAVNN